MSWPYSRTKSTIVLQDQPIATFQQYNSFHLNETHQIDTQSVTLINASPNRLANNDRKNTGKYIFLHTHTHTHKKLTIRMLAESTGCDICRLASRVNIWLRHGMGCEEVTVCSNERPGMVIMRGETGEGEQDESNSTVA